MQTQSPKDLYRYTDKAMPDSYPEWPKGPQVHAYLTEYAKDNDLLGAVSFNTAVVQMDRRPDSAPGWRLELRGPDGGISHEDFDFVAVCTGQFNEPQTLSLPGEDAFKAQGGRILHSSQYNDPVIAKGRRIVVLGGSKSATDIAVNAVNSGAAEVTLVYREPVWRIPYFIGGLVNFKRILYIRAQEEMFRSWGIGAMSRFAHAVAKPFVWANWRGLESLLKVQLKLGKCDMVPKERIEDGVNCSVPIATPDFFPMVADGRIKAVRGSFERYDGNSIVMTGGQRVQADVAVLAIGYKLGVPFLPQAYREKLVDPDGQYRLYRLRLVRYADGQLARQPTLEEMRDNIEMMLHFKRVERPAAGVYGGLCVAPYHFKHFDELLADIGVSGRRANPLVEKFTPPDAAAYGRFLASAPAYRAA